MTTIQKQWENGDSATFTFNGEGSGSVAVSSDDNIGVDRTMIVNIATTAGSPVVSKQIVVNQSGLREIFTASDGDFILANSGTFNVLKG